MRFKPALWDETDPDYAPGLKYRRGKTPFWRPSNSAIKLGYPSKSHTLPGEKGDHLHRVRAKECRRLTREMVKAIEGDAGSPKGTWAWVIEQWKSDPHGNYRTCKPNTRDDYDYRTGKWLKIIGHMKIEDLTYAQIGAIRSTMQTKGYSASLMQKLFSNLRTLARYARGPLGMRDAAAPVVETLEQVKMTSPTPRSVAPTSEQMCAIIDLADARGLHAFACGLLIQWTYSLRAVDVRGQWLDADEKAGGIIRGGKRWQDGLTWDMFDADLMGFEKVVSKTAKSIPEPIRLNTTSEIRHRLMLLRNGSGVGPVIVSEATGAPYTIFGWSQCFRRLRDALGLPKSLWMMDTRAGALTDAYRAGADPFAVRDAASHKHLSTTGRYVRSRDDNANKVVQLRGMR